MKVFISSVIHGSERERDAAERAATTLDHVIVRFESFGAEPNLAEARGSTRTRAAALVVEHAKISARPKPR